VPSTLSVLRRMIPGACAASFGFLDAIFKKATETHWLVVSRYGDKDLGTKSTKCRPRRSGQAPLQPGEARLLLRPRLEGRLHIDLNEARRLMGLQLADQVHIG
jgi:hypothetical protein